MSTLYACPECRKSLEERDAELSCPGGHRFPIQGGIPNFLTLPQMESHEEATKLERVLSLARERGWQKALAEVHDSESPIYRYVTDPGRIRFLDLLPLASQSAVLEIGPGLGQFTSRIASRCGVLHALEVVPGQAAFTMERCRQEGVSNLQVACGGDSCRLPYRDACFDLVICNLVLEWCGTRSPEPQQEVQERLLQEFRRVMLPGGTLFLSTKNRFSLRYLLGGVDEHAHLTRFGNSLPRWLLRAILALKGKERPNGRLYSHSGLKRMLERSGFEVVDSYWAAPEVRFPDRYISTRAAAIREARRKGGFAQGPTRLTRLLLPLLPAPLLKHFAPGLTFLVMAPKG